jgi:UMF1 family MFS transporter
MNGNPAESQLNNPKTVRAWYMYDWANSVYSLVITTAIFPIYYKSVTTTDNGQNDMVSFMGFKIQNSVLYSYALSVSFLIVAAMLPLLSGAADYLGNKKPFMKFFVWLGSLSCMGLYFFSDIDMLWWGIGCSILASIGYSGSLVFYDAFLPEIVTPDRYDRTSAKGYAMGYYGGVILMVICLALIMGLPPLGYNTGHVTRFTFILVGLWWVGFSYIPFKVLPDNPYHRKPEGNTWVKGYFELRDVWNNLKNLPNLKRFLVAFFLYNMGVQTVMYLATLFGTDVLHLDDTSLIATVVIIQLVGAFGAWFFAWLSGTKGMGNRTVLMIMIVIWIGICITAYFIMTAMQFFALAMVVGLVMGGIQSLSRATYSKLMPADTIDHTSYFSFYDVTYNISIVLGTFCYGLVDQITGSMRYSALALAVFFIAGFLVLFTVKSREVRRAGLGQQA